MNKVRNSFAPLLLALAVLAAVLSAQFGPDQEALAAPPLAPTPVANILESNQARSFRMQPTTAISSDTNSTGLELMEFNALDIHTIIDQTTTNTTTLKIQYSIDGSNWVTGATLVNNNAADASDITRVPMFGRYARVNQDVTNSNTITITLWAVGR